MILSTAARTAWQKAIKLDAAIDARVIRADGSGTPTTAEEGEELKAQAERAWAEYREAKSECGYSIDADKLAAVTEIVNAEMDPAATSALVDATLRADWDENDEHRGWIDDSSPQDIADWLWEFYEAGE